MVGKGALNGQQGSSQAREEPLKVISEGKRLLNQLVLKSKDTLWSILTGNEESSWRRLGTGKAIAQTRGFPHLRTRQSTPQPITLKQKLPRSVLWSKATGMEFLFSHLSP